MTAVREVWDYRNLVYNLAQRELRSRYKKSLLGWLWSLINPVSVLLVYTMVFGFFLRIPPPVAGNGTTESFALYLFCALIMWNFFSGTVNGSMTALQGSAGLLSKVYFPAVCPAIANQITVALQIAIEFAILVVVMAIIGNLSPMAIAFPLVVIPLALFSLGVGLAVSVFNVFFRDIGYLVGIVMNVWFYATPIVYPLSLVADRGPRWLQIWELNPLTQFVEISRDLLYLHQFPSLTRWAFTYGVSLAVLAIGWWIFQRKAGELTEEL